jgi:hypothetical protein
MAKPTAAAAPNTGKMRKAQQQKLKVVKLEVLNVIQLITADMDAETRAELAASMESCSQKLAGVSRFLKQDGVKP